MPLEKRSATGKVATFAIITSLYTEYWYSVVHLIRIYKSTHIIWIKGKFELLQYRLNLNFGHKNELKG